jgi:hypothetical protein
MQSSLPSTHGNSSGWPLLRLFQGVLIALPFLIVAALHAYSGRTSPTSPQVSGTDVAGTARLTIAVVVTPRGGATGRPHGESTKVLAAGEHMVTYWAAGKPGDPDLCDVGNLSSETSGNPYYLWVIDTELLATSPQQSRLRVVWRRSVAGSSGMDVESQETHTFMLARDEEHVIDVARDGRPESPCANLVLRVMAERVNKAQMVPSLLTYDLWLVHRTRDGRQLVYRQQLIGPSNADVPFYFRPLRWLPGGDFTEAATDESEQIRLAVSGTLRGETADDGSIQVSIGAKRIVSWRHSSFVGQGAAAFATASGEAVSLDLPAPTGTFGDTGGTLGPLYVRPAPGVSQGGGQTIVNVGQFFKGTQTSLYLAARRE